jgi:hypothetical protein
MRVPPAVAAAAVSALGMTCAALFCPPGPRPPADPTVCYFEPDPAIARLDARSAAREWVAREVAAGRMTLPEAAARFAWLDGLPPRAILPTPEEMAVKAGLPAGGRYTEKERSALQVVAWIAERAGDLDRAAEAARSLFLAERAAGRLDRLPEVPEVDLARRLERAEAEAARWPGAGHPGPAPVPVTVAAE